MWGGDLKPISIHYWVDVYAGQNEMSSKACVNLLVSACKSFQTHELKTANYWSFKRILKLSLTAVGGLVVGGRVPDHQLISGSTQTHHTHIKVNLGGRWSACWTHVDIGTTCKLSHHKIYTVVLQSTTHPRVLGSGGSGCLQARPQATCSRII